MHHPEEGVQLVWYTSGTTLNHERNSSICASRVLEKHRLLDPDKFVCAKNTSPKWEKAVEEVMVADTTEVVIMLVE